MKFWEHEITSGSVGNGAVGLIEGVVVVVEYGDIVVIAVDYRASNVGDCSNIKKVHAVVLLWSKALVECYAGSPRTIVIC